MKTMSVILKYKPQYELSLQIWRTLSISLWLERPLKTCGASGLTHMKHVKWVIQRNSVVTHWLDFDFQVIITSSGDEKAELSQKILDVLYATEVLFLLFYAKHKKGLLREELSQIEG